MLKLRNAILVLLAGLFLLTPFRTAAQEQSAGIRKSTFGANDQMLALGFGLGIRYGYPDNTAISPSIVALYDVGVAETGPGTFALGGLVGFKTARYSYYNALSAEDYTARWNNYVVAARASYHFALGEGFEDLDLYGGVMAGFRFERYHRRVVAGSDGR